MAVARILGIASVLVPVAWFGPAAAVNWPTFGGSAERLGYNSAETVLTPSAVSNLKLHWSRNLAGKTETQPLLIEQVATAKNGTHDEVFQTTVGGTVAALNASTGHIDWSVQLPSYTPPCTSASTPGVHGTPTIDPTAGLMYVVDSAGALHALNIGSGAEASGYPVQVVDLTNRMNGSFNHSSPTLVGTTLYITTSDVATCEGTRAPFHGAVIAFSTETKTVLQTFFPVQAATGGGGIWGPGGAMADSVTGNLFVGTGNALARPSYAPNAEAAVELDPNLNLVASQTPGPPILTNAGDLDFGSTPTPIDAANCPPLMSLMNKTGYLFLYQRENIAAGPTQVWDISTGTGSSSFIGMAAYDPTTQMLFIDNPESSSNGSITHGAVALQIASPACTLTVAWQTPFGTGTMAGTTRATEPVVADGVVWFATGAGNSVLAFNEANGSLLWNSSTQMKSPTTVPVTVANGQMFVQSGEKLYAWGL
jgi:outer membrane protein assembly factor BamB